MPSSPSSDSSASLFPESSSSSSGNIDSEVWTDINTPWIDRYSCNGSRSDDNDEYLEESSSSYDTCASLSTRHHPRGLSDFQYHPLVSGTDLRPALGGYLGNGNWPEFLPKLVAERNVIFPPVIEEERPPWGRERDRFAAERRKQRRLDRLRREEEQQRERQARYESRVARWRVSEERYHEQQNGTFPMDNAMFTTTVLPQEPIPQRIAHLPMLRGQDGITSGRRLFSDRRASDLVRDLNV